MAPTSKQLLVQLSGTDTQFTLLPLEGETTDEMEIRIRKALAAGEPLEFAGQSDERAARGGQIKTQTSYRHIVPAGAVVALRISTTVQG
ncbi:hypothetical protein ACSMXN_20840 [Jatrophihabitans sp. DSM 45814]